MCLIKNEERKKKSSELIPVAPSTQTKSSCLKFSLNQTNIILSQGRPTYGDNSSASPARQKSSFLIMNSPTHSHAVDRSECKSMEMKCVALEWHWTVVEYSDYGNGIVSNSGSRWHQSVSCPCIIPPADLRSSEDDSTFLLSGKFSAT